MPCMALGRFFYDRRAVFPNAAKQRKRSPAWRLTGVDVAMQPPVPPLPWTPAIGETSVSERHPRANWHTGRT